MMGRALFAVAFVVAPCLGAAQSPPTWVDVQSLLAQRCVKCHSGEDAPLGLDLTTYGGLTAGSWTGAVVIPNSPQDSKLFHRVTGQAQPRMPLDGPPFLDDSQIGLIESWIENGAAGPTGPDAPVATVGRTRPGIGDPVIYSDIEPILQKNCIKCHSDNSKLGAPPEGLRLDEVERVLAGGERLVVVPGNSTASELWRRVAGFGQPRMPFDGPPWLSEDDIRLIKDWIDQGAKDAEGNNPAMPVGSRLRLRGILTAPGAIDGAKFTITSRTRIDKSPRVGKPAEMRGVIEPDGTITATRLRRR